MSVRCNRRRNSMPARVRRAVLWTMYVGSWVWDKPVTVRHLDRRKRRRIDHSILSDDAVLMEQPGGHRIHFVWCQRLWSIKGHGAVNVVVEGCCVRPIASNGFYRGSRGQAVLTADQPVHRAFGSGCAMTLRAFRSIDCSTLRDSTPTRRQAFPARSNI